eukprot:TRINITY_DN3044_c0_g1_i1.p1 TRINITY_DN3044_c0_g1~~TRINITY_DN3044_c0_g1_i1.p1  ORF type:complete len:478 (-),score=155.45 TRINITY_DN3044_c0_g1_i1:261-1547(-)
MKERSKKTHTTRLTLLSSAGCEVVRIKRLSARLLEEDRLSKLNTEFLKKNADELIEFKYHVADPAQSQLHHSALGDSEWIPKGTEILIKEMKFNFFTQNQPVRFYFLAEVVLRLEETGSQEYNVTINSQPSEDAVICTHNNQIINAEKTTFLSLVFGRKNRLTVDINLLSNKIQIHFLICVRNMMSSEESIGYFLTSKISHFGQERFRPLSTRDVFKIHSICLGIRNVISRNEILDAFWDKYWPIIRKFKMKKIMSCWMDGTIWGFISKSEAEDILKKERVDGTFIIKFSLNYPGVLGCSVIQKQNNNPNATPGKEEIGDDGMYKIQHMVFDNNNYKALLHHKVLNRLLRYTPEERREGGVSGAAGSGSEKSLRGNMYREFPKDLDKIFQELSPSASSFLGYLALPSLSMPAQPIEKRKRDNSSADME